MELLKQTTSLLEQAGAAEKAGRAESLTAYRELLGRAAAPQKGDAVKLTTLLAALGLTLADAHADAAAMAEGARLTSLVNANSESALSSSADTAGAALTAHSEAAARRHREDEAETTRLMAAISAVSASRLDWNQQRRNLEKLKAANSRVFPV